MIATDRRHAPACATAHIVSFGLISTPLQVAIVVASVGIVVELHVVPQAFERIGGESHPLYRGG